MKLRKTKKQKFISTKSKLKKNKNKTIKKNKNKTIKKNKKGGKVYCEESKEKYPKCGEEGCVFLDNEDEVSKQQWKNYQEIEGYLLSVEGQEAAEKDGFAPTIISKNIQPCDLISIDTSENKAPCIVKRRRKTRTGEKIAYEEEHRDSWCRNYGVENRCTVNDRMYERIKNIIKKRSPLFEGKNIPKNLNIEIPDVDSSIDGDVDSINDEELGDMLMETNIDNSFTGFKPYFFTKTKMKRVKGITVAELINEMIDKLGIEKTSLAENEWSDEIEDLIKKVKKMGFYSHDFNESNIMIDIDNKELCDWINVMIDNGEIITPSKIKDKFNKENILKIVDWGLLRKV